LDQKSIVQSIDESINQLVAIIKQRRQNKKTNQMTEQTLLAAGS
jgi:hypothetical protein